MARRNRKSITVTLGTGSGAQTNLINSTMTWTPSTTPSDRAANECAATPAAESGAADREF